LAQRLLELGERQINAINERTYRDNIASSLREMNQAREQLAEVQVKLTSYRRDNADVDPESTGAPS
jgi:capsular polysaccharide transport system permease protein